MDQQIGEGTAKPPGGIPGPAKPRGFWSKLRDAFSAPDLTPEAQLSESWARRITDEQNLWLSAVQQQLQGDPGEAAVRYLTDAQWELYYGRRARAALGFASAGFVLREAGEDALAIACYRGAARQFRAHAEDAVGNSPREALWSLERAGLFLSMGRQPEELAEVRGKYAILNAALHPDQAEKLPEVFAAPAGELKERTVAGGPIPKQGVRISRDYTARLEQLLERL